MALTGAHVRTIGEGVMDSESHSAAVAANADTIAACTRSRVFLFDATSGDLIRSFGELEQGVGKGQLDLCYGMMRFTPFGQPEHILA